MKTFLGLLLISFVIFLGTEIYNSAFGFDPPPMAEGSRSSSGIKKYEFNALLDANRPFSSLAKDNYYTVIEGYINTCTICKRLEADFKPFLQSRNDVLIRRVHFPEGGGGFTYSSAEELAEHMEQLGSYNFFHVSKSDSSYQLTTCGTPHIEIYGPDKQLLATDMCGTKTQKDGLDYLRKWIRAEKI